MTSRDCIIYFLAVAGAIMVAALAISLVFGLCAILCCLFQSAKEKIQKAKRKIEIKHRFDKKPIEKCYCVDCAYYDKDCGMCYQFDQYVKDNGFCYKAEPRR